MRFHPASSRLRDPASPRRSILARAALLLVGCLIGLALTELALALLGLPRFHRPHSEPPQFEVLPRDFGDEPLYVNASSTRIRFVYDGNPRGYFDGDGSIEHATNSAGFRGPEFSRSKAPDTLRLLFLGDSFTFGEGVRDEDTYAERTAALLRDSLGASAPRVESYNLGVGGYNTRQELRLFRLVGESMAPDVVVLGYVLNDAEPPLFRRDPATGAVVRAAREIERWEGRGEPRPPETTLYRLRVARLVWKHLRDRERSRRTIDYYRSLYEGSSAGWQDSRRALAELGEECRSRDLPCYVVIFPILVDLDADHPFRSIHESIAGEVRASGMQAVDLLEELEGRDARQLWVHPADQHPNEIVHSIAATALAARLLADGVVKRPSAAGD